MSQTSATQQNREDAIRPLHANFPESELTDLRRRMNATMWLDRETVADATQSVQLATIRRSRAEVRASFRSLR